MKNKREGSHHRSLRYRAQCHHHLLMRVAKNYKWLTWRRELLRKKRNLSEKEIRKIIKGKKQQVVEHIEHEDKENNEDRHNSIVDRLAENEDERPSSSFKSSENEASTSSRNKSTLRLTELDNVDVTPLSPFVSNCESKTDIVWFGCKN